MHRRALEQLSRYFQGTKTKGMILRLDHEKGLEVYADAGFVGNWNMNGTDHRDSLCSWYGYIISYVGCPLMWKSQLQSEISLSSTEIEYTSMFHTLCQEIPIMQLLKRFKLHDFQVTTKHTCVHIKVFKDNTGAIELAKTSKYHLCTRHLSTKLHYFRQHVKY